MKIVKLSKQLGFTLIELVVVIVILGILAAFAIPRFVDLGSEARASAVKSLAGSVTSASSLAHAKWLAQGSTGNVTMEGNTIVMSNGYPNSATIDLTLGTQSPSGFNHTSGSNTWTRPGGTTESDCSVTYTPATASARPVITPLTTGC